MQSNVNDSEMRLPSSTVNENSHNRKSLLLSANVSAQVNNSNIENNNKLNVVRLVNAKVYFFHNIYISIIIC